MYREATSGRAGSRTHQPAVTMRCRNCGNTDRFVLLVELAVIARGPSEFADPDWGLSVECPACASTDVDADPVALLASRGGATG